MAQVDETLEAARFEEWSGVDPEGAEPSAWGAWLHQAERVAEMEQQATYWKERALTVERRLGDLTAELMRARGFKLMPPSSPDSSTAC